MGNPTTSRPGFESLNVNPKTVAFAALEPDVAELIGSIRWDAASVLNWRVRSSAWIAHQLLMRMGGEFAALELQHGQLAHELRDDLSFDAGARWVCRLVLKLREDQDQSGFEMIAVDTDRRVRREDGSFYSEPTLYRPGDFPLLYRFVQDEAIKCDLCKMPVRARRLKQRAIVRAWLLARGCEPIKREQKQQKSKAATASEAVGAESGGITVARAMHDLQRMPRSEQFEFAKDFTETVTSFLVADSQDYDEGQHIFTKMQTAAMIGGAHSLDDLRQRIARLNKRGVTVKPGLRAAVLRQCLDETAAILVKVDQMALLCEASDVPEGADYFKRWAASLRDFRWAINEDRKGRVIEEVSSE